MSNIAISPKNKWSHSIQFRYQNTLYFKKHITLLERFQVIPCSSHWSGYKHLRLLTVTYNLLLPMGHTFLAHKPTMVLPKYAHHIFLNLCMVFVFPGLVYYNKYHTLVFSLPHRRLRIKLMEFFNKSAYWPPTNWWQVAMKFPGP